MLEKLKEIIKQVTPDLDVSNADENTRLVEDLGFDSLGIMMLAMSIENELGVTFDGPIEFKTVGDVIDYCNKQLEIK